MPGWHLHPSAHVSASAAPLASQSAPCCHSSTKGCPAVRLWSWLWGELGTSLPILSLQCHSCHQVRGLMPELCQTPPSSLVLGAPCTWAKDKAQSQYLGHPPPSCHVPQVEIALPALKRTLGLSPRSSPLGADRLGAPSRAARALSSSPSHSSIRPPSANSAQALTHGTHTHIAHTHT